MMRLRILVTVLYLLAIVLTLFAFHYAAITNSSGLASALIISAGISIVVAIFLDPMFDDDY